MGLLDRVRTRLLPAVMLASGVTLLTAGLLGYADSADAVPPGPDPTPIVATAEPTLPPPPTGAPTDGATDEPVMPSLIPTFPPDRVSSRITVPALGIDLPVMKQRPNTYPPCDVAMYIQELGQPGSGRATYLYAHAQKGMFLRILEESRIENGKRMLGMIVEVYTNDAQRFLYEIFEVRRHQITLDDALAAREDVLWLQTSEGPKGTVGKTQVIARYIGQSAADPVESNPTPRPRNCG